MGEEAPVVAEVEAREVKLGQRWHHRGHLGITHQQPHHLLKPGDNVRLREQQRLGISRKEDVVILGIIVTMRCFFFFFLSFS